MYNSEAVFLRLFYNCFASCYFGYRCKIFLTEAKLTERKVTRLSIGSGRVLEAHLVERK